MISHHARHELPGVAHSIKEETNYQCGHHHEKDTSTCQANQSPIGCVRIDDWPKDFVDDVPLANSE
jgi:hypothetical protein